MKIAKLLLLCVLVSVVAAKEGGGDLTTKDPSKNFETFKNADAANKGDESLEEGGVQKSTAG